MKFLHTLFSAFALPFAAWTLDCQNECSIIFEGNATLHDFKDTGRCQPFTMSEKAGALNIPEVSLPGAGVDGGIATRGSLKRAMLEAEGFPLISGQRGVAVDLERPLRAVGLDMFLGW